MNRKERVLVTGANGLLGAHIVQQLNRQQYEVVALLRKNSNRLALEGLNMEIIEGDLCNIHDLNKVTSNCDYIIHSAANTSQSGHWKDFEEVNIQSTKNLIYLSKQKGIKRFVFISTANCFTNGSIENPGNEDSGFMPWLSSSFYAKSKYIAQEMILKEARENQFPALVLAPTFLIGDRDARLSSGKLMMHAFKKKWVFYPPGGKSFVDAEYAAMAIVNALKKGSIGASYLLAGENKTYREFFQIIKNKHRSDILLLRIPRGLLRLIGFAGSFIEKIFRVSLPVNKTNMSLLSLDNYFSAHKAQIELDMKPTNTEEAINKAINWFKSNKYIHD